MIARTAGDIFGALTNFGPGSLWYTQVVAVEIEPHGPLAAGSRIIQMHVDGSRREQTGYEVDGIEPDRELRLLSVGARPASTIEYRLTDAGGNTRLRCSIQVQTGGLLRLVESRLRRDLEGKLEATLKSFKESIERS